MAVELSALKMYWAYSLTGMHDLAMRQIIDGADALVSITSGPTKIEVCIATCITSCVLFFLATSAASLYCMVKQSQAVCNPAFFIRTAFLMMHLQLAYALSSCIGSCSMLSPRHVFV